MHGQLFVETVCEILGEVDETVQNRLFVKLYHPLLLQSVTFLCFGNRQKLFKEDDDKFDHLVVLGCFISASLNAVGQVSHQGFNDPFSQHGFLVAQ